VCVSFPLDPTNLEVFLQNMVL